MTGIGTTLVRDTDHVPGSGTTVATNTLVQRTGACAGLITTDGLRDLLEMREGFKEDRSNLRLPPFEPLVPRHFGATVPERVRANGDVSTLTDTSALAAALPLTVVVLSPAMS